MIISEEEYRNLNKEEVVNLINEYNRKHGQKFKLDRYGTLTYGGVTVRGWLNSDDKLYREAFMTRDEYVDEVKKGHIRGVYYDNGRICY